MTNPLRQIPFALTLAIAALAAGCRDASHITQSVPRFITPGTTVTTTGAAAVITLVLDVHGDVGRIGSFTGRLRFDSRALTYEGEVELRDATLRASNAGVGEIRVAGASAEGVDVAHLAAFRFTVKDPAALNLVQFNLEEVHELSHADLKSTVQLSVPRSLQ